MAKEKKMTPIDDRDFVTTFTITEFFRKLKKVDDVTKKLVAPTGKIVTDKIDSMGEENEDANRLRVGMEPVIEDLIYKKSDGEYREITTQKHYISRFMNGYQDNVRYAYAQLLENGMLKWREESNRLAVIFKDLFPSEEDKRLVKICIDDFLGIRDNDETSEAFFSKLDSYNPLHNEDIYVKYYRRFCKSFEKDPAVAVACLYLLIMASNYAHHIVNKMFETTDYLEEYAEEVNKAVQTLYDEYDELNELRNLSKDEKCNFYNRVKNVYEVNKTARLAYILAKSYSGGIKIEKRKMFIESLKLAENGEKGVNTIVAAKAAYEIFILYREDCASGSLGDETKDNLHKYLKKAADYAHLDACNIMGELLMIRSGKFSTQDDQLALENKYVDTIADLVEWEIFTNDKCKDYALVETLEKQYIDIAVDYFNKARDGHAWFRIAQCYEAMEMTEEEIIAAYAEAYARGVGELNDIGEKINYEGYLGLDDEKKVINSAGNKKCIFCSLSEENLMFAKTLPLEYSFILVKNIYETDADVLKFKELRNDVEEVKNLKEAFAKTKTLENVPLEEKDMLEEEVLIVDYGLDLEHKCERAEYIYTYIKYISMKCGKYFVADKVKLCVDFDETFTELHIDRLARGLGESYLPVFDNIYEKNASIELLSKIPLFTLNMAVKDEQKIEQHIVILGASKTAIQIMKDIAMVCVANKNIKYYIYLVDEKAEEIEKILQSQCPGLLAEDESVNYYLRFRNIEKLVYLTEKDTIYESVSKKLIECDYFVCATKDDLLNVELARKIRIANLRNVKDSKGYYALPPIAVLSRDKKISEGLDSLTTVPNYKIAYPWYEGLNLISFGDVQTYYSYTFMEENWIQKWGKAVFLAYCSGADNETLHENLNAFYSRYYERDSSYMSALFFIYRLHMTNSFREWYTWDFNKFTRLVKTTRLLCDYDEKIANPEIKHQQAELEHARWCAYMKANGWQKPSDDSKICSYMNAGGKKVKHQLHSAKLHAYLIPWNELGDRISDNIIFAIEKFMYMCMKKYNGIGMNTGLFAEVKGVINICIDDIKELQAGKEKDENLKQILERLITALEEKMQVIDGEQDWILECYLPVLVNNLKDIYDKDFFGSTGLQRKLEEWYPEYLGGKRFSGSTKGHNLMIVSRTAEFVRSVYYPIKVRMEETPVPMV